MHFNNQLEKYLKVLPILAARVRVANFGKKGEGCQFMSLHIRFFFSIGKHYYRFFLLLMLILIL